MSGQSQTGDSIFNDYDELIQVSMGLTDKWTESGEDVTSFADEVKDFITKVIASGTMAGDYDWERILVSHVGYWHAKLVDKNLADRVTPCIASRNWLAINTREFGKEWGEILTYLMEAFVAIYPERLERERRDVAIRMMKVASNFTQ